MSLRDPGASPGVGHGMVLMFHGQPVTFQMTYARCAAANDCPMLVHHLLLLHWQLLDTCR